MDNADSLLKDFDWQLNLSLSSDKLATLNEALVNVDFDILTNTSKHEYKSLEMNTNELSILISALENANQALQEARS